VEPSQCSTYVCGINAQGATSTRFFNRALRGVWLEQRGGVVREAAVIYLQTTDDVHAGAAACTGVIAVERTPAQKRTAHVSQTVTAENLQGHVLCSCISHVSILSALYVQRACAVIQILATKPFGLGSGNISLVTCRPAHKQAAN
jgi:hypothetical protein